MWNLIGAQSAGYDYTPAGGPCYHHVYVRHDGKSKGVMLTHRNLAENATCLDMGLNRASSLCLCFRFIMHIVSAWIY